MICMIYDLQYYVLFSKCKVLLVPNVTTVNFI